MLMTETIWNKLKTSIYLQTVLISHSSNIRANAEVQKERSKYTFKSDKCSIFRHTRETLK